MHVGGALGGGDPHGAVDEMPDLRRLHRHVHVLMADVLEQDGQVDFLLVVAAQPGARLLADDRHDRLMIELGVVQTVEQMDRARARGRQAHPDLTGEFGVRAGHERRHLLVAGLHELERGRRRDRARPAAR